MVSASESGFLAYPTWPHFEEDEVEAVARVLHSGRVNYWTGTEGRSFEEEFADYLGVRHAIAVANGTVALELALYALGIGPGDEVIVPTRTFIATASAVVVRGARPVVADICPESQNLSAETIEPLITSRTKAIIPVHLAGWPCDMDPIRELADRHGLKVIEDCAQAHGARYKGRPVGSLGDVSAFSFCQDKIMTTGGEGGLLATDDPKIWRRAWEYKDHGKNFDRANAPASTSGFRLLHDSFGTNWRMTEMQAAIGRVQLRKLEGWVASRRRNAQLLAALLSSHPAMTIPVVPEECTHSYYKFYVFIRPDRLRDGWSRDRLVQEIHASGVPCFTGSSPEIYLEKSFVDTGWAPKYRFPVAKRLGETSLMLPVHPTLTTGHIHGMASIALELCSKALTPAPILSDASEPAA